MKKLLIGVMMLVAFGSAFAKAPEQSTRSNQESKKCNKNDSEQALKRKGCQRQKVDGHSAMAITGGVALLGAALAAGSGGNGHASSP